MDVIFKLFISCSLIIVALFLLSMLLLFLFFLCICCDNEREWGVLISHFRSLIEYSSCKMDMMWQLSH